MPAGQRNGNHGEVQVNEGRSTAKRVGARQLGHYPPREHGLPYESREGPYVVKFARSEAELQAIQRLRFEVFNLELGEGLEASFESGLDRDRFDSGCHHLMVLEAASGTLIGTYRLQTREMAAEHLGFYCDDEFDLARLPEEVVAHGVELGRACIHLSHRHGQALYALWRGLAAYLMKNRRRYLFGCCSLTSREPADGPAMFAALQRGGHVHPTIELPVRPDYLCGETVPGHPEPAMPKLFGTYLRYGAKVVSPPALDRQFGTIDYLIVVDAEALDPRMRRLFFS